MHEETMAQIGGLAALARRGLNPVRAYKSFSRRLPEKYRAWGDEACRIWELH